MWQSTATHARSFDRSAQVEDPAHIEALVTEKAAARASRAIDRLHHAAPSAKALFLRAAERGTNLGALTRGLLRLLEAHGPSALEAAIAEALASDSAHLGAVRHALDRQRHARALPPPLAVALPEDPRLRTLSVRPHPLSDYDALHPQSPDEHEPEP